MQVSNIWENPGLQQLNANSTYQNNKFETQYTAKNVYIHDKITSSAEYRIFFLIIITFSSKIFNYKYQYTKTQNIFYLLFQLYFGEKRLWLL